MAALVIIIEEDETMFNAIFDAFVQVGIMLALLIVVFIVPAILQAKWDEYRGKGPILPPGAPGPGDCHCSRSRDWDRPVW